MSDPDSSYPTLFREYIIRNTQYALTQVTAPDFGSESDDHALALRALHYSLTHPDAWAEARQLLVTLAPKMERAGYRQEWAVYLSQGLEQCQQLGDLEAEARLRLFLGELYEYQGMDEEALAQLTLSISLFDMLHEGEWQGRALNRLAALRWRRRAFEESTAVVQQALAMLPDSAVERAYSHFVLGGIAFEQGALVTATHHLEESLRRWQTGGDIRGTAWGMTHLGNVRWAAGDHIGAIEQYEGAAQYFEHLDDPVHLALVQVNIGTVHLTTDDPIRALTFYRLAEPTFERVCDRRCLAALYTNQGRAYKQLEQWAIAESAFERGINLWRQLGNLKALVTALDSFGMAYAAQRRWAEAGATFREALRFLDQLEADPAHDRLLKLVMTHLGDLPPAPHVP